MSSTIAALGEAQRELTRAEISGMMGEVRAAEKARRRAVEILRRHAQECLSRGDMAAWDSMHAAIDEVERDA